MNAPLTNPAAVAAAIGYVRLGRASLQEATYRLDEAGFRCLALDDLHADTAALLAFWAGRRVPDLDPIPDYIAAAAVEWRCQRGRSY